MHKFSKEPSRGEEKYCQLWPFSGVKFWHSKLCRITDEIQHDMIEILLILYWQLFENKYQVGNTAKETETGCIFNKLLQQLMQQCIHITFMVNDKT